MFSIDDMYNPVMHQDIMNPSMGYINPMCGGMGMYPYAPMLGGIRMQPQPMQDKYEAIERKDKECNKNFKSVMKALGWMALGGFIPLAIKGVKNAGGLGKAVSSLATKAWNGIKSIF